VSELPHFALPIVGRRREIDEIAARMRESRAVTIAGAGGIGKTRVAVEVAAGIAPTQRDGVWFVDLAPIADPELVSAAVASAIGLEMAPNADPIASLTTALASSQMTIVLDNCEHVVTHAARLAQALVAACPNVRILATSREPLGIEQELGYRLGTLDAEAACELFVTHARAADPQFEPTPESAATVREICVRLDGIPLAIQLVAACVRTMTLGQLRSRLDGRFRLLVGESRAASSRHKTMQALIDWSYDLLSERERVAFRRLGVFSGGFTLEAARRVLPAGSSEDETAALLSSLVEKSMVAVSGEPAPRYALLESMRHYALQRLADAEETETMRAALAQYVLERSAQAAATFGEGSEEAWLAAFTPDVDNVRAALEWARGADPLLAARIAGNLADFWEYGSRAGEGLRRSEAILAALERPDDPAALPLLIAIARIGLPAHVYRRTLQMAERAHGIALRLGDEASAAEALRLAGRARYLLGIEPQRSQHELAQALQYLREHGKAFHRARAMRDYASALALADPVRGGGLLLEALELAGSLEWPSLTLHVEINVAEREFRSGNVGRAAERARHIIEVLRGRRAPHQLGHALTNLSSYLAMAGEYDESIAAAREAIEIGTRSDTPNYIAIPLQAVAIALVQRGAAEAAAELLGFAEAFYARFTMEPEPTEAIVQERLRELLRLHLDAATLAERSDAGRLLTESQACLLAQSYPADRS